MSAPLSFGDVNPADFSYELPDERIARHPLEQRDQSKLLHYRSGNIAHERFDKVPELLPDNAFLFFNDTRVIPARIIFFKDTGARIELFLLHPVSPSHLVQEAMQVEGSCVWQCMVGNFKKWKEEQILSRSLTIAGTDVELHAEIANREAMEIRLSWKAPGVKLVDVVEAAGQVPLPPYIDREVTEEDKPRYQTVYSSNAGAVAAPTAGLHFSDRVLEDLATRGIGTDFLTLHVSAGTFQPIKAERVTDHPMHSEQILISRKNLHNLLVDGRLIVATGTTSMRTLESLYWYGVKLIKGEGTDFHIPKLYPYGHGDAALPAMQEAMQAVLAHMENVGAEQITGETEIFIFPGYTFRVCQGLITNFHLPGSTLILLIAAFVGEDWRKIYEEALQGGYRFLSYGDSSLLIP